MNQAFVKQSIHIVDELDKCVAEGTISIDNIKGGKGCKVRYIFRPEVLVNTQRVIGITGTMSPANMKILNDYFKVPTKQFKLFKMEGIATKGKSKFIHREIVDDKNPRYKAIAKAIQYAFKNKAQYVIIIDGQHDSYTKGKHPLDFIEARFRGRYTNFFDFSNTDIPGLIEKLNEIKKVDSPWIIYTNKHGMTGVDFKVKADVSHVVAAIPINSKSDYDQSLGRGTRVGGVTTTGTLIIDADHPSAHFGVDRYETYLSNKQKVEAAEMTVRVQLLSEICNSEITFPSQQQRLLFEEIVIN